MSAKDKSIKLKMLFENPEYVSLGCQYDQDSIIVKFDENLLLTDTEGNPVLLDKGIPNIDTKTIDLKINIQPQIIEDAPE